MSHRLTIKGQVTVPKHIRDFLGLRAGASSVQFSIEPDGSVRLYKAQDASRTYAGANVERPHADCYRVLSLLAGRAC